MTIMLSGGRNAMLYRQVGTFLSYRQVDDMFGCCHWDKWVKQCRSHRPFGDTLSL